jgi:hypothetical protein
MDGCQTNRVSPSLRHFDSGQKSSNRSSRLGTAPAKPSLGASAGSVSGSSSSGDRVGGGRAGGGADCGSPLRWSVDAAVESQRSSTVADHRPMGARSGPVASPTSREWVRAWSDWSGIASWRSRRWMDVAARTVVSPGEPSAESFQQLFDRCLEATLCTSRCPRVSPAQSVSYPFQ